MRLSEIASTLNADLRPGGDDAEILCVSAIRAATPGSLVFAEDAESFAEALDSRATAIIVSPQTSDTASDKVRQASDKSLLLAPQPKLAFAQAGRLLKPTRPFSGIDPTACIDPSATLGEQVSVGPFAVVEANAQVGAGTRIGAGTVIGAGVKIGDHCQIYPRVVLYPETEIGYHVVLHAGAVLGSDGFGYVRDANTGEYLQFPQQGRLIIEDNVEIGANTTIDRGALEETRIERGVKIDNLVPLGHNVRVGPNVVLAAQTGVSGSSTIGANAIVGGQVGIGDHADIGDQVILGSGSGVLTRKKVKGPGVVFWGRPARPLRQYLKELAALARLARTSKQEEEL